MFVYVVKQAKELHKKLKYVNEHQKCELNQRDEKLEKCRRELLEARVKLNSQREGSQPGGDIAMAGCSKQELRMVCFKYRAHCTICENSLPHVAHTPTYTPPPTHTQLYYVCSKLISTSNYRSNSQPYVRSTEA